MEDNNILPQLVENGYCNSTSWAEMRLVQATGIQVKTQVVVLLCPVSI